MRTRGGIERVLIELTIETDNDEIVGIKEILREAFKDTDIRVVKVKATIPEQMKIGGPEHDGYRV